MKQAIAYYRVSSKRQGKSGLGLDAQRKSVRDYAGANKIKVTSEFTEVESGTLSNRPILQKALAECRDRDAILLIAKIDRLARKLLFIATLMEASVRFIAVDKPYADEYELHMEAANAQRESRLISKRTKEALQAAKRRGIKLGTSVTRLHENQRKAYRKFAKKMKPVIKKLQSNGLNTVRSITDAMNKKNIKPFRGSNAKWHISTVHRLLKQIQKI